MCAPKEGVQSHQAPESRLRASFYVSNPPDFDLRLYCIFFFYLFMA